MNEDFIKEEIKKNILHIKKKAQKDKKYHYINQEMMDRAAQPRSKKRRKGILKGNKSLIILIIDILFIIILLFIIKTFLLVEQDTYEKYGYSFKLRAISTAKNIIPSLTVKKISTVDKIDTTNVLISFSIEGNNIIDKRWLILPQKKDAESIIRGSLPLTTGDNTVQASIDFQDNAEILKINLKLTDINK